MPSVLYYQSKGRSHQDPKLQFIFCLLYCLQHQLLFQLAQEKPYAKWMWVFWLGMWIFGAMLGEGCMLHHVGAQKTAWRQQILHVELGTVSTCLPLHQRSSWLISISSNKDGGGCDFTGQRLWVYHCHLSQAQICQKCAALHNYDHFSSYKNDQLNGRNSYYSFLALFQLAFTHTCLFQLNLI